MRSTRRVRWLPAAALFSAAATAAAAISAATPHAGQGTPAVQGTLHLETFTSRVFGNSRTLRVLVPPSYDAPSWRTRVFPVLYLNDGQNLFDAATSTYSGLEWRVDETVHDLIATKQIHEIIVVGIDHAGRNARFHEYFPYRDRFLDPPDPDPQGGRYPEFLVDEVIPFIEGKYRVAKSPELRGLGGSSAGALAAVYAVIKRPGVFGRLLVESPSVYVDDYHVLRDASGVTTWPELIHYGVGTNERNRPTCDPNAPEPELVTDVKRLRDAVNAGRGMKANQLEVTTCGRHDEAAWAGRLRGALLFLYAQRSPAP